MSRRWNLPGATVEAVRPSSPFHCGVRMKTSVLIVDDEPIARRGIRRYLAEHDGIEVVGEAANGISAVEQINELHPDIVFLDVLMPDLDGFGVIENLEPAIDRPHSRIYLRHGSRCARHSCIRSARC